MKRVLLLVFLIVSLMQLALEHDRIYLIFLTAALACLVRITLIGHQHAQNTSKLRALIPWRIPALSSDFL